MKQKSAKAKGSLLWKILERFVCAAVRRHHDRRPHRNNYASIINMVLGTESTKTIGDPGQTYYEADSLPVRIRPHPLPKPARALSPTAPPCC